MTKFVHLDEASALHDGSAGFFSFHLDIQYPCTHTYIECVRLQTCRIISAQLATRERQIGLLLFDFYYVLDSARQPKRDAVYIRSIAHAQSVP